MEKDFFLKLCMITIIFYSRGKKVPVTVTVTLLAVAVRDPSLVMLNIYNEAIKHEFC